MEQTTIEIEVLQHGVTPVSWPALTVIATDAASGTVVRAEARATGSAGWSGTRSCGSATASSIESEGSIALQRALEIARSMR